MFATNLLLFCNVTLFFVGLNLQQYLPGVEELLSCDELQELRDNASFQYLLRAGYEQLERVTAQ